MTVNQFLDVNYAVTEQLQFIYTLLIHP